MLLLEFLLRTIQEIEKANVNYCIICMHIYLYLYLYLSIYLSIYTYIHTHIYIHIYTYIHTYIYIYIYIYIYYTTGITYRLRVVHSGYLGYKTTLLTLVHHRPEAISSCISKGHQLSIQQYKQTMCYTT